MYRIVICEPEQDIARQAASILRDAGYDIAGIYRSFQDAGDLWGREKIDLALIDVSREEPQQSAKTALDLFETYNIPSVLLSDFDPGTAAGGLKYGLPFVYAGKDLDPKELKYGIEAMLYGRHMEQKLAECENRYRGFFENTLTANFIATLENIITDCNSSFAELLGFSGPEDAAGISLLDLFAFPSEGIRLLRKLFLDPKTSDCCRKTGEWVLRHKNGSHVFVLATVQLVYSPEGSPLELRGILLDLTEIRDLEEKLIQSRKMETIGRISGSIAHDFNNIITAIIGYCDLLKTSIGGDPDLSQDIDGILLAARKAGDLTRYMMSFSRNQPMHVAVINAEESIRGLEGIIRRLVPGTVKILFNFSAEEPYVFVNQGRFEQMIINLVMNAKDALRTSGFIEVSTRTISGRDISRPELAGNTWLEITVRDNGTGIAPGDLTKIFDPYFSTKAPDRGTGLGLQSVLTTVNHTGGHIFVDSEYGAGTKVLVFIPISRDKPSPAEEPLPEFRKVSRNSTIVLAEDDETLRNLLSKLLSKTGYRVIKLTNPGEASAAIQGETDFILLTDIVMPEMTGYTLAETVLAEAPGGKVLFMTGYNDEYSVPPALRNRKFRFIKKPFFYKDLISTLDELV
ncbi:response regulator [Breznakiella homolactica]|uniref:histidine kinase n=1 Tax=Breznakiella homolactica TaxID=2798577 RepID=A0A7T8BDD6_9SPIR|nr:response regulator [Breznakiella homolactica]QQO11148.1 response regulator [Breznakiella homolactica]